MSAKQDHSHQKHVALSKPHLQQFGRNELAIIGSSCSSIQKLAGRIASALSDRYKISYVDAEHTRKSNGSRFGEGIADAGIDLHFIQQNSGQQLSFHQPLNSYQLKPLFNEQDLILLNGNHFEAQSQIVVIDPNKPPDADRLGDVKLIILPKGMDNIPENILRKLSNPDPLPVFNMDQVTAIAGCIADLIAQTTAPLSGLVLAGGQSTRMHTDKTKLNYHGKPQRIHLYELLTNFCDDVFLSCRQEQAETLDNNLNTITDSFLEMGPLGALLSAFREYPNSAWLTVACDLPLLSPETLQTLVDRRNPSKIATAFKNSESGFPEPLITIWEPKSYQVLLQFLGQGYSCPRKALINSDVELLEPRKPQELMNANTPEEYEQALETLKE